MPFAHDLDNSGRSVICNFDCTSKTVEVTITDIYQIKRAILLYLLIEISMYRLSDFNFFFHF